MFSLFFAFYDITFECCWVLVNLKSYFAFSVMKIIYFQHRKSDNAENDEVLSTTAVQRQLLCLPL
jgi:hypothetical protein